MISRVAQMVGSYDSYREVFTAGDGTEYHLTPSRLADKLASGELEFVFGEGA